MLVTLILKHYNIYLFIYSIFNYAAESREAVSSVGPCGVAVIIAACVIIISHRPLPCATPQHLSPATARGRRVRRGSCIDE